MSQFTRIRQRYKKKAYYDWAWRNPLFADWLVAISDYSYGVDLAEPGSDCTARITGELGRYTGIRIITRPDHS